MIVDHIVTAEKTLIQDELNKEKAVKIKFAPT